MLPERLMNLELGEGVVVPRFLSPRDAVWVRVLTDALEGFEGRPARELDAEERGLIETCHEHGASRQAARGVMKVLARFWRRQVMAAAKPAEIRRVLFERAADLDDRERAISATAQELGIDPGDVLTGLFADRPGERCLQGPDERPDPQRVVEMYNLALVQGLLFRSERVAALVRQNVRSVVRFAKLKGLLCTFDTDPAGTLIELSGPLSLFRNTLRYGNALASFFPALVVTPGWSLGATCLLTPPSWQCADEDDEQPRRYRLVLDASAPVHSSHQLPKDADSAAERKLMRDVRRAGRGWTIERETTALRAGRSVFFPDFRLVKGDHRVLVELVGYYTAEYLENKLRKLREARVDKLVVCVDEALACSDQEVRADVVLRYKKRVDAAALLDAADRLAATGNAPTTSSPSPACWPR